MEKQLWKDVKKTLDKIPDMKKKDQTMAVVSVLNFLLQKVEPFYETTKLEEGSKDLHEES